ncbi:MAG: hypothetical protein NW208_03520, partial [Bryobacter sp.]|nr:hypothetical protein [Bryobacter sp.]
IGAADLIPAGTVLGETLRKAKPGQTIRYRTRKGEERSYEIPTVEEQQQRAYEQYAAKQQADEGARLGRETASFQRKKQLEEEYRNKSGITLSPEVAQAIGVPAGTKFLPEQIDEIARAAASIGAIRQRGERGDEVMSFHDFTDDSGNVITEKRYKSGKTEQVKQGRIGKSKGNPSPGLSPGQAGVQNRFEESKRIKAQAEVEKIQSEEDKLHEEKIELGERLQLGVDDRKAKRAEDTVAGIKARLSALDQRIAAKQAAKRRVIERASKGGGGAAPPRATMRYNPKTGKVEPI